MVYFMYQPEASNPGQVRMSFGGVGRNLAGSLFYSFVVLFCF